MDLGSADSSFVYKVIIFAMVITFTVPTAISIYCPEYEVENPTADELLESYREFTGSTPTSRTQLWALSGIFTPIGVNSQGQPSTEWGQTQDGWIYGNRITSYSPSNYDSTQEDYTVTWDAESGLYKYSSKPSGSVSISNGDLYSAVTMEVQQKSTIFFTAENKHNYNTGFFYDYTGYRYAFMPLENYTAENANGDPVPVKASNSSLSLIFYQFTTQSGLAGQLIVTGSDYSVSYINSTQIISAFNSSTYTSTFPMSFNGCSMSLVIRLNPYYLGLGYDPETCWNNGLWDVMVYGTSVESSSYVNSPDYSFNVWSVFETLIDLLTFNTDQYGLTGISGTFASLAVSVPLYAMLIAIGLSFYPVLIFAGILAVIQAVQSVDLLGWLGI